MTKNQLLRQIEDIRLKLQEQLDLEATIPTGRIGVEVDDWPLSVKLALVDAYERAGLREAETLDQLPALAPEMRAEVERLLLADQYGEDPPG
jgi:hypothetical protein